MMNTRKEILEDLIKFIGEVWFKDYADKLTEESELESTLKIAGDDTDELMYKIFTHYQIDVGEYNFDNYFDDEGFLLDTRAIVRILTGKKLKRRKNVTISMLIDAIENKRWSDKGIEE